MIKSAGQPGHRVLVVNDAADVLELLTAILKREGYRVMSASNASKALEIALTHLPDIVVTDVVMPGMSGIELCRVLKQNPRTSHLPVVLVSGLRTDSEASRAELSAAGADDYLSLPFRRQELLDKVGRLTQGQSAEVEHAQPTETAADAILTNVLADTVQAGAEVNEYASALDLARRQSSEAELHKSKNYFRALTEHASDVISILAPDGRILYQSPSIKRVLGYAPEEMIGRNVFNYVFPEDQLRIADALAAGRENPGVQPSIQFRMHHKDGSWRLIEAIGNNLTSHEEVGGVVINSRDITDRFEAQERLRASVQQLETTTALATAVKDWDEVDKLLEGLADSITQITDYRSCFVRVFSRNPPYRPGFTSFSANIPQVFVESVHLDANLHERVKQLIENGMRIEVGELGFASYYPPSHHGMLVDFASAQYKTGAAEPLSAEARWHEGDELFVPLRTQEGEYIGYVSLDDPRSGRAPDRESVLPVVALARQITQLLAQQQASELLAQQAKREALTNRISNAVRQSLDLKNIFRTVVDELGAHLNVDRCTFFMVEDGIDVALNVAEYGAPGVQLVGRDFDAHQVREISDVLKEIYAALDHDGILVVHDAEHDPRITKAYTSFLKHFGVRSIMYVTLNIGKTLQAVITMSSTRTLRHWEDADVALARAVALQSGMAIQQANLYHKAEAATAREALINRLSGAIRASLSLPEVLETATRELGRALDASRVYLRFYDFDGERSQVEHEYVAPGVTSVTELDTPSDDSIWLVLQRAPHLVVHDAMHHDSELQSLNEYLRSKAVSRDLKSAIYCPVMISNRFRGALCIHQTDNMRHWLDDEVALVEAVAAQLATGIAQAELFELTGRAKKEWETTFNAMSDGIFIFGSSGDLIRVNQAGAAMEDSWPHLMLGRHCCDILRSSHTETYCVVERVLQSGRSVTMEVSPDRLNRPLVISGEPLIDGEHGTIGVVCTARDLSELRKAEAIARERQTLLTNILESVRDPICAIDTNGRFLWCNSATVARVGFTAAQLIGSQFLELIHPADRTHAQVCFESALAGTAQSYEARYQTSLGETRYAAIDNAPLIMDACTTGVLWIARDITEQKEQRQRAAQADKLRALGQLASGVAHDFNNALAAILGRAQLMRRQVEDDGMLRNLDIIQTAAEDAAATVRRIQAFARQAPSSEFETLEVVNLLRDSIEITRTRWENEAMMRGLDIEVELQASGDYYTRGNASELREVFVNMIVNAVDAMPEGGHIEIVCERTFDNLLVKFIDTGMGMTDEVRERIFEPFYTTKGIHGTGLGLAVSYSIIERHKGLIRVTSDIGNGSTFELVLPAMAAIRVPDAPAQPTVAVASLAILVVDDEPFVRDTLGDMLRALGHTAVAVDGGRAALEQLGVEKFDVVFTDLSMPEMDGWDVARAVKAGWPGTAVVLVTGYGKGSQYAAEERALVDGVIGKPFNFAQVSEIINEVLGSKAAIEPDKQVVVGLESGAVN